MRPKHITDITYTTPFFIGKVLWTSPDEPRSFVDLHKDLDSVGAIQVGPGRFAYRGPYAAAISRARSIAHDIGARHGHEEWYLPKVVSGTALDNFGCTSVWPDYLLRVGQYTEGDSRNTIESNGKPHFLDPVQCASFYESLAFIDLEKACPLKIMDISGYTYRNEFADKLYSTMKTIEFLRAEYVFVGRGMVRQARSALLEEYIHLFESCRIKWRLVVGRGCYDTPTQEDLNAYDEADEMEAVPILDLEIYSLSLGEWVEVVGGSYFHDHKLKRFGRNLDGLESGCMGVGLTRLAGLLLEYLGPDLNESI